MTRPTSLKIAPSLASAPLLHLAAVIEDLERARVDWLHFDLEDGHFVPAMTLGTRLISELRPLTKLPFDVHLMVANPETMVPLVAELGGDSISIHYEACLYPRRALRQIKGLGKRAGLAFNPKTPWPPLAYLRPYLDYVTILTTEPEFPECPFLPLVLPKIQAAAEYARRHQPELEIVADGGVETENVREVVEAGATVVVSGRAIFRPGDIMENVQQLRHAAGELWH